MIISVILILNIVIIFLLLNFLKILLKKNHKFDLKVLKIIKTRVRQVYYYYYYKYYYFYYY